MKNKEPYRIGKKNKRALLTQDGKEVVIFSKGQEAIAERVCGLLNVDESAIRAERDYSRLIERLKDAFLPENVECDGSFCAGCWKDIVREVIKEMSEIDSARIEGMSGVALGGKEAEYLNECMDENTPKSPTLPDRK